MCALQQKNQWEIVKSRLGVDIGEKVEYNLIENSLRVVWHFGDAAQVYEVFSHTLPLYSGTNFKFKFLREG